MIKKDQHREEEQRVFNMAKQDIPFLKHLELVTHDDRPDFVLKDKDGHKIGLEHFRADVYRVQDENSPHISGGHTILNDYKDEIFRKYHPFAVNNSWTDEIFENATNELCNRLIKGSLDMQSNYVYEAFLDNLHVGIHGRQHKPKGHIEKSKNYPNRESYDLMGFLIEIPIPSFEFYFETYLSQKISQIQSLLHRYPIQRRFNGTHSRQKINGLPITNEIWNELDIFEDIDFIIIETYDEKYPIEHHGQYFTKYTPKPRIYPAFSFGFTDIVSTDVQIEYKDDSINALFTSHTNQHEYDVSSITKTTLKAERRKYNRKSRKHFDRNVKRFIRR